MACNAFVLFGTFSAVVVVLNVVRVFASDTNESQCKKYLADNYLKNLINTKQKLATPCPCHEHQMEFEYSFKQDDHCYTEWFFTDGVKQTCCYSQDGRLITTSPDGGYLQFSETVLQINDLRQLCCGSSEQLCKAFYRLNVPDTCEKWSPLTDAQSGGDTEIESIDNFRYTFNGHGEYIFLRTNGSDGFLEVQIRTDYIFPGNKDATEIVAFAIRVKNTKHSETVHIIKNTTSGKVLYLNDSSPFSGVPKQTDCFSVFPAGLNAFRLTPIFEFPDLPYLTVNIRNKRGNHNITGVQGLAENAIEEKYLFRNGSHCTKNCSEYEMFRFGESWSLEKYENESVFDYDLTKGNFSMYNHQHTSPRFWKNLLGNLTALFENYTEGNITEFNRTCRNSWDNSADNQCLLAIARTHNISVGRKVHEANEQDHEEFLRRHDKPPRFMGSMPDSVTLNYGLNKSFSIDLKQFTDDENNNSLQFAVEPDFEEYTIVDGVFNWTVGTGLRNTSIARVLLFLVTDKYNHTVLHALKVSYCGCEHYSECRFDSSGDGLQTAHCNCPPHLQGTFCETPIDFCNTTKCYEPEKCNHTSTNRDNPCAPCPKGRRGEVIGGVQHCDDINECEGFDTSTFQERCVHGLECINQIGDWNCTCPQDTLWMSFGNSSRPMYRCQGNYSYLGSIGIRLFETEYRDNQGMLALFKNVLSAALVNDTLDTNRTNVDTPLRFLFVPSGTSVLNFTTTNGALDYYREYTYTFKVRLGDPVQTTRLQTVLNKYIKENNSPRKVEYLNVTMFKEKMNVLCELNNNGGCEINSTNCKQENGTTHCECKQGFNRIGTEETKCSDIDECAKPKAVCGHGHCTNAPGNYSCDCFSGFAFNTSSEQCEDIDECENGSPCADKNCTNYDGGYNCSCFDGYTMTADNLNCTDINECVSSNYQCGDNSSGNCTNLHGSFKCECIEGYYSEQKDDHTTFCYVIADVDECANETYSLTNAKCKNKNGSFEITCVDGYGPNATRTGDHFQCADINECNNTELLCGKTEMGNCTNTNGSYKCECAQGYQNNVSFNKVTPCEDIDECNTTGYVCGDKDSAVCQNYPGKYNCSCKSGFDTDKQGESITLCHDIDECKGLNATFQERCVHGLQCINTNGNWNCSCPTNTIWMSFGNSSYSMYRCQGNYSYLGSIKVRLFDTEYKHNQSIPEFLKNVLSAALVNETFDTNKTDVDTPLKFLFVPSGTLVLSTNFTKGALDLYREYTYTFKVRLGDPVQTTRLQTVLDTYIEENNSPRKIEYLTVTIFKEEENVLCRLTNNGGCEITSTNCKQANGTTHCECKHGFHTYGSVQAICFETDECSSNPCQNGTCSNTVGSYTCSCGDGYIFTESNGRPTCEDFNECESSQPCDQMCTNLNGSYSCSCFHGYTQTTDNQGCTDIDECAKPNAAVCKNGTCTNYPGNYSCDCDSGFIFNTSSEQCEDIDECFNKNYFCKNATNCTNSIGSWDCLCNSDATAVRINNSLIECHDINECHDNDDICGNGTCIDGPGNYSCNCKSGFEIYADGMIVSCKGCQITL
ncbi:fibrillin-1-like [Mya arenaria]|uniref:fibrillin-1-like n=1 Tax=Mya arenaria TaxID=6604 RepID=UPI0022E81668|nr:fibrillin-1-like [Mya arenaria]